VVGPRHDHENGTRPARAATSSEGESVDDDEHLAAYNAYLARLNQKPE
jgi:Ser/Thr protein kinase RdoA (MazF antagonist)